MKHTISCLLLLAASMCCMAQTTPVKMYCIGNSGTEDGVLQEFMPVCKAGNFPITFGYGYKGGSTYAQHVQRYNDKERVYNYKKWTWGQSSIVATGANTYTFNQAIAEDAWDIVTFQQGAKTEHFTYTGQTEKLTDLVDIISTDVTTAKKRGYVMIWSDQVGGKYLLPAGQIATWDTIKTTCQRVMQDYGLDFIIPCGTAVQNARSSYLGDNLNRDTHHLSYTHGRYIAALTWYEALSGKSCIGIAYHPAEISDYAAEVCQVAAHQAVLNPYELYDMSKDYGQDKSSQQTVVFDLVTDTVNQRLAQTTGYFSSGYKMTARSSASNKTSVNGQPISCYNASNPDYIKVANIPAAKTKIQWSTRDANTGERTWYINYLLVDAGTDLSTVQIADLWLPYDTIIKAAGACEIRSLKVLEFDLSDKDTLQDIYFFQTNINTNALVFRTLNLTIDAPKPQDTNTALSVFTISDLNTELRSNPIGYANVAANTFPVYVTLASKTSKARVYQNGQEIAVSNEPDLYFLTTPNLGDSTELSIVVTAEDTACTQIYSAKVVGANFKVIAWDLKQAGNTAQQTSILNGQDYVVDNRALKLLPASSDCNFGDGVNKAYGLYVRATSAKYGDCGFRLEMPKQSKLHLMITMCPGAANVTYSYYGIVQKQSDAAPTEWYTKTVSAIPLGIIANKAKGQTNSTLGKWIDLSTQTDDQYCYLFHAGGGMRYQQIAYTLISTEQDPTDIPTATNNPVQPIQKYLKDGQLYIQNNHKTYTILGTPSK